MDTSALECVWNGRDGWLGRSECRRGELLPAHESKTTLGAAVQGSEPPEKRPRQHWCPRMSRRKYDQATRRVVWALRADGLILSDIAARMQMPIATVYSILQEEHQ